MIALENQDVWLQAVAPSDLSEVQFLQTKVDPHIMKTAREQADEYVRRIGTANADFDSGYEHFRQSAPRPGLTIYGCFRDYQAGGNMVVTDPLAFERRLQDWIFTKLEESLGSL